MPEEQPEQDVHRASDERQIRERVREHFVMRSISDDLRARAVEGTAPTRVAYAWTLILGGALAFILTASLLLLTFHLASLEWATRDDSR
jgi:hypothetical protein